MRKTPLFAAFGLLLLASPLFASADTLSDLQAQVQALLAQIAQLQNQMQSQNASNALANASSTTSSCPNLTRTLSKGISGSDVTAFQQFLVSQNLLDPESVSGFFGSLTQTAVQQWQTSHGIASSGTPDTTGYGAVGPTTRAAIAHACAGSSSSVANNSPAANTSQPNPQNSNQSNQNAQTTAQTTQTTQTTFTTSSNASAQSAKLFFDRKSPESGGDAGPYGAPSNGIVTFQASGFPADAMGCVYTVRLSDGNRFPFPGNGNCIPANGNGYLTGSNVNDLGAGTFYMEVAVLSSDGSILADATSSTFTMTERSYTVIPITSNVDSNTKINLNVNPTPTFTGQAAGSSVNVRLLGLVGNTTLFQSSVPVVNGRWSATVTGLHAGPFYNVQISTTLADFERHGIPKSLFL